MSAVIFVITIPTEVEEERLNKAYIARKSEINSNSVNLSKINTLSQSAPAATKVANILQSENVGQESTRVRETRTTAVTSNASYPLLHVLQQYGTFTKEANQLLDENKVTKNSDLISSSTEEAAAIPTSSKHVKYADKEETWKSWEGLREIIRPSRQKQKPCKDKNESSSDLNLQAETCMETVVREILKAFQVVNAVWTKDTTGRTYQVIFTIDFDESYEDVLEKLYEWGIGEREGSAISVMNCIASKTYNQRDDDVDAEQEDVDTQNINAQKRGIWDRFMNTVRSRLNVAQIVRDVRQDAAITFDFVVLLVSAAILACFGLVEDSTTYLTSSMLISPLMGPIIAAIFGTAIRDHSLCWLGVKNELLGITLATLVGFLFGLVLCSADKRFWTAEGLTAEMLSRCELHSLVVGILIALPSGAAAAVAILGGNIGSLVGVAISASLLPPAVNSGLLWALACLYRFFDIDNSRYHNAIKTNKYSNNQAAELAILGSISMCLTISNVLCVYIMGVIVLKIKEIAPVTSRKNGEFWKHDIKYARDLCKMHGFHSENVIIDEFANLPKEDRKALGFSSKFLHNIRLNDACYQNTWSPIGNCYEFDSINNLLRNNYSTVHRIDSLNSNPNFRKQPHHESKRRHSIARPSSCFTSVGATYKLLPENDQQLSMPSVITQYNNANIKECRFKNSSSRNKSVIEDNKRRKFIVTPAADPFSSSQDTATSNNASQF